MKLILRTLSRIISIVPLSWALAWGRGAGWFFGSIIRYHRRSAVEALTRSFPEKTPAEICRLVGRMYGNLGMNVIELFRLESLPDAQIRTLIQLEGEENIRAALEHHKGVIVLTAHIGSWDLLCTIAPRLGYPLTVISKDIKGKALNNYWMETRARFGLKFVPAHNAYRQCLAALKKNELVGFIMDQNMIRTEGVFVDFFGRPACTTPGLAFMSAQSRAPVIPVFMVRQEGGRHVAKILPALEPPADREPETIRRFTQECTRIIEQAVREHPDQWIWLHRRWRTKPA